MNREGATPSLRHEEIRGLVGLRLSSRRWRPRARIGFGARKVQANSAHIQGIWRKYCSIRL
jgi:hypothetical protein